MWNVEEYAFSAMEPKLSAIKALPEISQSPNGNRATDANMSQERIPRTQMSHTPYLGPTCYELRWAEGTETFTGFTSAMACGQARLTRAAHSKWMTWKHTQHHVLDTCRIHSPSLKNVVARFWEVWRNESTKPE